jgi:cobalt/nickel transport protein
MPFSTVFKSIFVLSICFCSQLSYAHLQLIYTDTTIVEKPKPVPAKLIFWHPMENGHVMDMAKPLEVSVYHRGQAINITDQAQQTLFTGLHNSAISWDIDIPVKRSGDYVVVVTPEPYYEASEDIYIQQITKVYLNRNQMPTDWDQLHGLKAEILPLAKPYNILAGTNFRGQVLKAGKPVPFAEIEVEYMIAPPNLSTSQVSSNASMELPGGGITILSDAQGVFSMAIPKAGYWGFAALGVGTDDTYQDKPLSQDAVIWVQAHELN